MKKILSILIAVVILASLSAAVEGTTNIVQNGEQTNRNTQDTANVQLILNANLQDANAQGVETGDTIVVVQDMRDNSYEQERGCAEEMNVEQTNIQTNENTQNTAQAWQAIVAVNVQREVAVTVMTDDTIVVGRDMEGNSRTQTCAPNPPR